MQTFMKDLTDLNEAIESTLIPANFDIIQKYLATQASMTTALNGLPAEYARAYLQVQTLKYDENNDPVDVTAEEALSVPESVISRYRQSWGNLKNTLESLKSRLSQFEITRAAPLVEGHDVIEFDTTQCFSKECSAADFDDKSTLFTTGGEVDEWIAIFTAMWLALTSVSGSEWGELANVINIQPALLFCYKVGNNAAQRKYYPLKITAKINTNKILGIYVQARGRLYTGGLDLTSTTGINPVRNALIALLHNDSAWSRRTGTINFDTPTTWTVPTVSSSASLVTDEYFDNSTAQAPGGMSVLTVDKVPLDIDLEDLDTAISSL